MSGTAEVYALRYATDQERMASGAYYRHGIYDEPDLKIGMDFFFWLIRARGETILVDCAFSEAAGSAHNLAFRSTPFELLGRMGVAMDSVDHVVISHMHFDHTGNIGLFPNAMVHMAAAEYEFWTGPFRDVRAINFPVISEDVAKFETLLREQRLKLIDDFGEIGTTGVRVQRFPGHTPGQLITELDIEGSSVVLASDAAHYYDEFRLDRPFNVFTDIVHMLASFQALRDLEAQPNVDVVPGHDPKTKELYVEVEKDCFDLASKVIPT